MRYVYSALEFVGGIAILWWRLAKLIVRGQVSFPLLLQQMVTLGINSIPISVMVLSFSGAIFTFILADNLVERGAGSMLGGLLLVVLLRDFIPVFTGIVLAGKIGASITSEIGSMKTSEQLDALKALSTDPDWYLYLPRVLGGTLMMPVIATFAGYGGWYAGYLTANSQVGMAYATFTANISLVDMKDFTICLVKSLVFATTIVLTACHMGSNCRPGAAGVGRAVTNSVVVNIVLLFALDLLLTALFD